MSGVSPPKTMRQAAQNSGEGVMSMALTPPKKNAAPGEAGCQTLLSGDLDFRRGRRRETIERGPEPLGAHSGDEGVGGGVG